MQPIDSGLDYAALVQDALRDVARRALRHVAENGLPGAHHFYLTFRTRAEGVALSEDLLAQYPDEMTVVLQHDFRDLEVDQDTMGVTLRFGGLPRRIVVPLEALTAFYDPSVQFLLRFDADLEDETEPETGALRPSVVRDRPNPAGDAVPSGPWPEPALARVAEPAAADEAGDVDGLWDELGVEETLDEGDAAADIAKDAEEQPDDPPDDHGSGGKVVSFERFRRER